MRIRRITTIAMMAGILLGGAAQASTVIDFTAVDNVSPREKTVDSLTGDSWAFSDTTLLFDGSINAGNSNTKIYGGAEATWAGSQAYNPAFRIVSGAVSFPVNTDYSQEIKGMLVWNKADFLNHSTDNVVFDENSSMSLDLSFFKTLTGGVRFVVNDDGTYYASNTSNKGDLILNDPGAETWAEIDTSDYSFVDGFSTRDFSNIQGVGVYLDASHTGNITFAMTDFQVTAIPEPATLGLVVAFGGGVLFIRRMFMM